MENIHFATMYVGGPGSGKTYNACTYPKVAMISTEPNHHWVWELNPHLKQNIVWQKYFIPDSDDEGSFKTYFKDITAAIGEIKGLYSEGKVETLCVDNLTYLVHNRWLWLNRFQPIIGKGGELDTRGMYGQLRTWGYEFTLMRILSFKGHVVATVHEMLESEDALDKKIDKTMDKVPNLLGSFRQDVIGLFSNVFYLTKVKTERGYEYKARTNKGAGKEAKNRFNLPEIIDNVSYQRIMEEVNKSMKGGTQ